MTKPNGRPTKYTQEYIEKEADALDAWFKIEGNIFFNKFVVDREYGPEQVSIFAKVNEKFSQARARARMRQETFLMESGLFRKTDCTFTMFTMKNVCGWIDKMNVEQESNSTETSAKLAECDGSSKNLIPKPEEIPSDSD